MKKLTLIRNCVAIGLSTILSSVLVSGQETAGKSNDSEKSAQEQAIRSTVELFANAYNAHDAKAVADLFLPQAQIVDEDDNTIQGRDNIQNLFADVFADQPETGIKIDVESIRFIGTNLAVEMGSTITVPPAGETPEVGRYSVLHFLSDGKWLMGLVRDIPAEPTHRDHLEALGWLVGDWIDESREGTVRTTCRWADNDSFLLQEITVHQAEKDIMTISQRIGWDPLRKHFKAWVFDSEGGYGESSWTPTETGWLIKATSVNSDGTTASATNHVEPIGLDRYLFQSVDRVSGNELVPSLQVTVVRQPPQPEEAEQTPQEN